MTFDAYLSSDNVVSTTIILFWIFHIFRNIKYFANIIILIVKFASYN